LATYWSLSEHDCLGPESKLSHLEITPGKKSDLSGTAYLPEADDFDLAC